METVLEPAVARRRGRPPNKPVVLPEEAKKENYGLTAPEKLSLTELEQLLSDKNVRKLPSEYAQKCADELHSRPRADTDVFQPPVLCIINDEQVTIYDGAYIPYAEAMVKYQERVIALEQRKLEKLKLLLA